MNHLDAYETSRIEWLEQATKRHHEGEHYKGEVHFAECGICGHVEWRRTCREGSGYSVEAMPADECPKCRDAFQRAPELATWVVNVALKAAAEARES